MLKISGKEHKVFNSYVRFEVFTVVAMKNAVFSDVTPCGSCKKPMFWWNTEQHELGAGYG
jgi:cytidine deaminase